ncbi:hypothetical protein GCM10017783_19500 [Deinococcus piscis]|uniref:Uncharacterized protein n=1 Tax=Deinococcus piscis TaxID=394230 RepID=A0ABQ3K7C7_9DEIO|nr:hypothetical protein GCM10017783_19500 [Deinococcus piscis]
MQKVRQLAQLQAQLLPQLPQRALPSLQLKAAPPRRATMPMLQPLQRATPQLASRSSLLVAPVATGLKVKEPLALP